MGIGESQQEHKYALLAQFNAKVKEAQARPLPTPEQDPEMAEWNRINRLSHEGRATRGLL